MRTRASPNVWVRQKAWPASALFSSRGMLAQSVVGL
jgi:hypothetical protein